MFLKLLEKLKSLFIFTTSYSNNVFLDPLTNEEEEECIKKANMGDKLARNKLIEHNLRLVVFLAKKYENTGVDLEDLVSIGNIGLIKGVNTYKLDKNIKRYILLM